MDPGEDWIRASFGCDNSAIISNIDHCGNFNSYGHQDYNIDIERQTSEVFRATKQSSRVICRRRLINNTCWKHYIYLNYFL